MTENRPNTNPPTWFATHCYDCGAPHGTPHRPGCELDPNNATHDLLTAARAVADDLRATGDQNDRCRAACIEARIRKAERALNARGESEANTRAAHGWATEALAMATDPNAKARR